MSLAGLPEKTKGSNKTEIEAGTGARVQLSRPNEFFQGSTDRVLLLSGNFKQVLDAMSAILVKLEHATAQGSRWSRKGSSPLHSSSLPRSGSGLGPGEGRGSGAGTTGSSNVQPATAATSAAGEAGGGEAVPGVGAGAEGTGRSAGVPGAAHPSAPTSHRPSKQQLLEAAHHVGGEEHEEAIVESVHKRLSDPLPLHTLYLTPPVPVQHPAHQHAQSAPASSESASAPGTGAAASGPAAAPSRAAGEAGAGGGQAAVLLAAGGSGGAGQGSLIRSHSSSKGSRGSPGSGITAHSHSGPLPSRSRHALGALLPSLYRQIKLLLQAGSCGCVIGKGGETVRKIASESGCDISLSPQELDKGLNYFRIVTISGHKALTALAWVLYTVHISPPLPGAPQDPFAEPPGGRRAAMSPFQPMQPPQQQAQPPRSRGRQLMQAPLPDVVGDSSSLWQQQGGGGGRGAAAGYGHYTQQGQQLQQQLRHMPGATGLESALSATSLLPHTGSWGSSLSRGGYSSRELLGTLMPQHQHQHSAPLPSALTAGLSALQMPSPTQLYMPGTIRSAAGAAGLPGFVPGGSYAGVAPGYVLAPHTLAPAGSLSLGGGAPAAASPLIPSLFGTPFTPGGYSSWVHTGGGLQPMGAGGGAGSLLMPGGSSGLLPSPAATALGLGQQQAGFQHLGAGSLQAQQLGLGGGASGGGGGLTETLVLVQPQMAMMLASASGARLLASLQPSLGVTALLTDQVDLMSGMRKLYLCGTTEAIQMAQQYIAQRLIDPNASGISPVQQQQLWGARGPRW